MSRTLRRGTPLSSALTSHEVKRRALELGAVIARGTPAEVLAAPPLTGERIPLADVTLRPTFPAAEWQRLADEQRHEQRRHDHADHTLARMTLDDAIGQQAQNRHPQHSRHRRVPPPSD